MAKGKIKFKLQGHEKFVLRDGWLNKGIVNVAADSKVFQNKNAPDIFGIGNNMVKSLRYWMKAMGLIDIKPGKGVFLTNKAEIIKQYDPYFEDCFTIWVLHSAIAKNIEEATTWYMYFNRSNAKDATRQDLEHILTREIQKYVLDEKFSEKSVKNDIDVLINMYSKPKNVKDPEEKNISPFSTLGIIKNEDGVISKKHPQAKMINEWVILYELASLMCERDQISIDDVIEGECGISKIYQMSNVVANDILDKLDTLGFIHIDRTAGLDIIYKEKDICQKNIMKEYYQTRK